MKISLFFFKHIAILYVKLNLFFEIYRKLSPQSHMIWNYPNGKISILEPKL